MEFESTHVVITTVLLLLVDIDIADNILVCLIIKMNLKKMNKKISVGDVSLFFSVTGWSWSLNQLM